MVTTPEKPSALTPDRLFLREAALALAAGIAIIGGAHLGLERSSQRQTETADLALASQEQRALVEAIGLDLDRLSVLEEGSRRAEIAASLRESVETFSAREAAIATRTPSGAAFDPQAMNGFLGRLEIYTGTQGQAIPPLQATTLAFRIKSELLPWMDSRARALETSARKTLQRGRAALRTALALQLGGLIAVMLALALATLRRLRTFVRQTAETERANRFRLLHEPLTEMPNATYLHAHLAPLVAGRDRAEGQTAVLRVDLDKYNMLRRSLGQRTGDDIIRLAAARIQRDLRQGDFAAHLGNDDFVVVAGGLEDGAQAASLAQRLQATLGEPFAIHGGSRQLSCSIGVTLVSDDEPEVERLLANAEIALAEAQASGHGQVGYFRKSQRREAERREVLYGELIHGLEHGEIVPFFQPQIDLSTGALTGFEALVRWHHPRQGLLSPAAFLDFAEAADLTDRLGEVVLGRALEALRAWDRAGLVVPKVGVNFAMGQLRDPRLIEKIKWEVERFDIDPSRLAVEVLETVLIKSDADMMVRNLQGLASAGLQIELDDFGTGHASISNLRRFAVNCVKIDRSFVFGIETSAEQQKLTASMIALAHALGIETLAEGIETAAAVSLLRDLGCDHGQGYVIAKPMSFEQTFDWLASFHPAEHVREAAEAPGRHDPNTP